jgi:hypothetical protein
MKLQNRVLTAKEKIEAKAFLLGDSIIQVKEEVIKADENGTAIGNAKKWAKNHEQEIVRHDIGNDSRLHIHEVFSMDDLKNTAIPFQTPGTDLTARPRRGIAIYLNILRDILNVKGF